MTIERKDCNVMMDGKNIFDQPVKDDLRIYDDIQKIATVQGDDCTNGCLLDYLYFKKYYKLVGTCLFKQPKIDADPREIQQINFTENLKWAATKQMFFYIEEAKKTSFTFFKGNSLSIMILFFFYIILI